MLDQDKQGSKFRFHYSDAIDAHDSTTGLHPASQILNFRLQFRAIHTHTHTHDSTKRLCSARQNATFTAVPREWHARFYEKVVLSSPKSQFTSVLDDPHARSYERVARDTTKSQFHYSFARSTRTILRKGCAQHPRITILPQFRAIDTHDLTKKLCREQQNVDFTTVSDDPRTIPRKGCIFASIFRTRAPIKTL